MAAESVWSVVRAILSADMTLTADAVIAKAKAQGVRAPDAAIRTTVHTLRKRLKKKAAEPAKVVPAAARQIASPATSAAPSVSSVVRAILSTDLTLPADQVISRAKTQGVLASDATIRGVVHNVRSELRKAVGTAPAAVPTATSPVPAAPPSSAPSGVTQVLSNVALVNGVVAACGGVETARQVAEAVRACGGADVFAQYLDLVAGLRTGGA